MRVASDGKEYTYARACEKCGLVLGSNDHSNLSYIMSQHMDRCGGKPVAANTIPEPLSVDTITEPVAVNTIPQTVAVDTIVHPCSDVGQMETGAGNTNSFMSPAASIDEAIYAFSMFDEAKKKLLRSEDVLWFGAGGKPVPAGTAGAKPYLLKSAWRRMARFFGLSIDVEGRERIESGDGKYIWIYRYRITHPCGAYVVSEGVCTSSDSFFTKGGKRVADEADVMLKAQTVAINRGVSDLLGSGEVSAEELMRG